jgi:hypothetical protein
MKTLLELALATVTGGGGHSTSPEVGSFWFGRKESDREENGAGFARSTSPEVGSFWTGGHNREDDVDENGVGYARSVSPRTGSFWTGR